MCVCVCVCVCARVCVHVWACAGAQENEVPACVCVYVRMFAWCLYVREESERARKETSLSLPPSLTHSISLLSRVYTDSKCSHVCVHTHTNADACVNICTSKHLAQPKP